MMSKRPTVLRQWRNANNISLEALSALIAERGFGRPSTAKLSRIERDQTIPAGMIAALQAITGIPARKLRPDLAELFEAAP
jgi:transcriptional regulator with XRE-family HTH domain